MRGRISVESAYDDEDPEYEAFARRIFDLVGPVGRVSAYTTGVEFYWVIEVEPPDPARSLPLNVLMNDLGIVVEGSEFGWWDFEWADLEAVCVVIEQIVARGGIVYRRSGWMGRSELRDLNDAIVSGPHNEGVPRLFPRRSKYAPYG